MENVIVKIFPTNGMKLIGSYSRKCTPLQRWSTTSPRDVMKKPKILHPYRKIHPWKSLEKFSKSLVDGIIHNGDGLVVVNKPYGISGRSQTVTDKRVTGIVNDIEYTLSDAAPHIATAFGYPSLKLIKTPEKFTSGVAIFAANEKIEKTVEKSLVRAQGMSIVPKTYWAVTTRVPNEMKGEMRLAMRMQNDPSKTTKQPIIITSWTQQEQKKREIKILNVQFKVISNSTGNLSSLVEIKTSTAKWHALRLFAATVLYSPILGDNRYGSRVKNIMGKWMNISPFVDAAREPPILNKELLEILKITPGKEMIIPAHVHLREVYLPMFLSKSRQLILTAPPMPEFMWTCRQLEFKHEVFKIDEDIEMWMDEDSDPVRHQAVT